MGDDTLDTEEAVSSAENFGTAYESHSKSIYRFLYWRTKHAETAEDLTSNVFEKAWRSRRSFKGGSVQAWLYRIARNVLIDHWRKRQAWAVEDVDSLHDETSGVDLAERLDRAATLGRLQTALDRLPADMRLVVTLRFVEGLACKEVAARLGLSESNVRVIQYRALRRLRQALR